MAMNEPLPASFDPAQMGQAHLSLPSDVEDFTQSQDTPSGIDAHELLINILGTKFSITAGADPAYMDEVLAQYEFAVASTQSISGMKDPLQVAILTGFLLCDEINKLKLQIEEEQANDEKELSLLTQKLLTRIDQILVQETDPAGV